MTSARLAASAGTRSQLFPKTRSWFALDAPLALLSPLSVLRVLFSLTAASWALIALMARLAGADPLPIGAAAGATALLWLVLLRITEVGLAGSRAFAGYLVAAVGLLVWSGRVNGLSIALCLFFVPGAVFVALFLGHRDLLVHQLIVAGALALALAARSGPGGALAVAVCGCLALSIAPLAVLVLARAARRHDTVDPDTGLPNGFGLAQRLRAQQRHSFVVAAVSLDGIGSAREALGYQVGTELLRRAVEDLGQVVPADAVIGRVDGDELVVTLGVEAPMGSGETGVPGAVMQAGTALAGALVGAIGAGRYLVGDIEVSLRAHVGLSAAPWDGTEMAELVRRSSLAARRTSAEGGTSASWDTDDDAMTADDLALLGDLRLAADRGQLRLVYQPQIATAAATARSVEALLRWNSPVHGWVSPGRFIPLAERTGLIDRLTDWVLTEALDAQVRWRSLGIDIAVSVNLSATSLPMPGLSTWIIGQLSDRHLPASCLTVEVTETAVADPGAAVETLRPLHEAGIRISIDDFGTGFTSLAALPTLPLDELKVDQCFILRSSSSPADEAVVRTVCELGHRLGLEVVAEGVETAETAEHLTRLGYDVLQGYLFARPMPEDEVIDYLVGEGARRSAAQAGPVVPPGTRPRSAV